MLVRVDRQHVESFLRHLAAEGFPATKIGDDVVDVLFPASPTLFAAAAELEDWIARVGEDASVTIGG